jgi:hypothetical protein
MTRQRKVQFSPCVRRCGFILAIVAISATIFAAPAMAKDASRGGCIGATPPHPEEIGPHHVRLSFYRFDECVFPARWYVEIRGDHGGWVTAREENSESTGRRKQEVTLQGLHGHYEMRTGVAYFGSDTSSPVGFTTQFQPAQHLRAVFTGDGQYIFVHFHALTSGVGEKEHAWIHYSRNGASNSGPLTGRPCDPFGTTGREDCEWTDRFSVHDHEWFNAHELKRGVEYSFRITVWNDVYVDAYGRQQTSTLTVRAGDNFKHEVVEQPSTPPRAGGPIDGARSDSGARLSKSVAGQYRRAGKREVRTMNRAVNRAPAHLRTVHRFGWFVGKADPSFGFVCGYDRDHVIGTPVRRASPHGAGWQVFAESGPIRLCPGSATRPVSEPLPPTGAAPVTGSGTDSDPYRRELTGDIDNWKRECDQFSAEPSKSKQPDDWQVSCVMAFPERSLDGFFASEHPVPAYKCPKLGPNPYEHYPNRAWALDGKNYNPFGTTVPTGVEVRGLGPIGIYIPEPSELAPGPIFQTKQVDSSATNWLGGMRKYQVVLHCENQYFSPPGKSPRIGLGSVGASVAASPRPGPDLVVSALANPVPGKPGTHSFVFAATIANRGSAAASGPEVQFYLSPDRRLSSADIRIPPVRVRGLPAGATQSVHERWKVPRTAAPGIYHLLACADVGRDVAESSEHNNCAVARGTVTVIPPGNGPMEESGTLTPAQGSNFPTVRCSGDQPYVQRGRDETVPLFHAWLEWPAGITGWIARDTVPYKFGSRAVTSYTIVISRAVNSDDRAAEWWLQWSCTSAIDKAYLVFGL